MSNDIGKERNQDYDRPRGRARQEDQAEEVFGVRNLFALSRLVPSWKDETSPNNKEKKKNKNGKEDRNIPEPKRKPQQYTPLTVSVERYLHRWIKQSSFLIGK